MLTRIEIDGFKSFADFSLDIPPFLAIVGQNASGKSNLFDAIQFLRRLAGGPVEQAFEGARGEAGELFRHVGEGVVTDRISMAVEVLLEPSIVDRFGKAAEIDCTRLRYEVVIDRSFDDDDIPYLYVTDESVTQIQREMDAWAVRHSFSERVEATRLRYGNGKSLLRLATDEQDDPVFVLSAERAGEPSHLPASIAQETVLSSISTAADYPSLYALRREFESWQLLHLEPAALRAPSPNRRTGQLGVDGSNLPLVLRQIEQKNTDGGGSLLDEIVVDLTRVVRGLVGVEIVENKAREQLELYLQIRNEGRISARVASDGTLRVLALLAALYDHAGAGLICFEEPENGIYPQKLRDLMRLVVRFVTDFGDAAPADRPLKQLLVNSHSPVLLQALPADLLVVFDWVTRADPGTHALSRVTRARVVREKREVPLPLDEVGHYITEAERREMIGIDQAQELLD
jgi:predicted ATPase